MKANRPQSAKPTQNSFANERFVTSYQQNFANRPASAKKQKVETTRPSTAKVNNYTIENAAEK
jgi:hypothetical protein